MNNHRSCALFIFIALCAPLFIALCAPVSAQEKGKNVTLPPITETAKTPAKDIFGRRSTPTQDHSQVVGFYARGCLAGAQALPIDGDAWQVMRLSRNRNWGHPKLIAFLERMSRANREAQIWPGLLVGDMSQPRGGPMITGHASHQVGLDADVWLTPMPDHRLSKAEREHLSATNVVREDGLDIDPDIWTPDHLNLIRSVAEQSDVQRIFVNPAIKKAICREAKGDRAWLSKVRPMYGHNYHFHIRLTCPAGEAECEAQAGPPAGDGCDASLAWWFTQEAMHPKPSKPKPPLTLAQLPNACARVVHED